MTKIILLLAIASGALAGTAAARPGHDHDHGQGSYTKGICSVAEQDLGCVTFMCPDGCGQFRCSCPVLTSG